MHFIYLLDYYLTKTFTWYMRHMVYTRVRINKDRRIFMKVLQETLQTELRSLVLTIEVILHYCMLSARYRNCRKKNSSRLVQPYSTMTRKRCTSM